MRFLVTSANKYPVPPEMALGVFEGCLGWLDKYTKNGKFKAEWAEAGVMAGGGILEASSAEEVNAILAEFPLSPFADTKVIPIVSAKTAFEDSKRAILAMMPPKGK